jgi:hypothetical protein
MHGKRPLSQSAPSTPLLKIDRMHKVVVHAADKIVKGTFTKGYHSCIEHTLTPRIHNELLFDLCALRVQAWVTFHLIQKTIQSFS